MIDTSIYELLSNLCYKLREENASKNGNVPSFRACRARAFETLLKSSGQEAADCDDRDDPLRELDKHLFEMRMRASVAFQRRRNDELQVELEKIEENQFFRTPSGKAILTLLLKLRSKEPPDPFKHLQDAYPLGLFSALRPAYETNPYITFTQETFKLPELLPLFNIGERSEEHNPYCQSMSKALGRNFITQNLLLAAEAFQKPFDELLKPKNSLMEPESSTQEPVEEKKDSLKGLTGLSVQENSREKKILNQEDFLRDLKNLCMGFSSGSFIYRERRQEFVLAKHTHVENITKNTLKQMSHPFLEFGTCVKRLHSLLALKTTSTTTIFQGFIFRAFCKGLSQYLLSVREFIYYGRDKSLLGFNYRMTSVAEQVSTLGRICYINPNATESTEMFPSGAKLLRHLSSVLSTEMRREIFILLANLLVPCIKFYMRHLEKWIFQGVLQDPHGELFILFVGQYEYDTKKFFEKAYMVQKDIVPDFLDGFDDEIVLCGKYTMLLKAFNPLHPLFDVPKPELRICLTQSHVEQMKQEVDEYRDSASAVCGPEITIEDIHRQKQEKMDTLKILVEQERTENLKKWQLERQQSEAEAIKMKQQHLQELKDQIESIRVEKEAKKREEVAQELLFLEQQRDAEEAAMRQDIEERLQRIQRYQELNELANTKLTRMESLKKTLVEKEVCNENYKMAMKKSNSDILNDNETVSELARNRAKVLGSSNVDNWTTDNYENCDNRLNVNLPEVQLTACQRNKLKVMSHEFNIDLPMDTTLIRAIDEETMSELERNRRRILYRDLNSNTSQDSNTNRNLLSLNFETERMRNRRKVLQTEFDISIPCKPDKLTPMSTTSDFSSAGEVEEEKLDTPEEESRDSVDERQEEAVKDVPETFPETIPENFPEASGEIEEIIEKIPNHYDLEEIMKFKTEAFQAVREDYEDPSVDLSDLNAVSLKDFLRQSIAYPLKCHMSLLNGEIMKMFLRDLDILGHWQSLRNYFLLMDGEFASHICDGLIERLENGIKPGELLNFHTLHGILDTALGFSVAGTDANSSRLSFTVTSIPQKFNLLSPNVLEHLRLSYRVEWPVNLILSSETLQQYLGIFQYLLKVRRMGWLLENMFQHLKDISRNDPGIKDSPQFRHIHAIRHKFSHFVSTLQNHITLNALQASWTELLEDLKSAKSMIDLYRKHANYIKRIRFLCMLNRQSVQFFNAIEDVFKLIIRFTRILKGKSWLNTPDETSDDFIHPRYEKLKKTEENFDKLVRHVVLMGWKIVSRGYQAEIGEFIFLLNHGGFYVAEAEFK
ncbi:uncharacterized protein DMENIID0001_046820 [Sergentomyia squamirostris]